MAILIEMGVDPDKAATYAQNHPTVESAVEAMLRDDAAQPSQATGPPALQQQHTSSPPLLASTSSPESPPLPSSSATPQPPRWSPLHHLSLDKFKLRLLSSDPTSVNVTVNLNPTDTVTRLDDDSGNEEMSIRLEVVHASSGGEDGVQKMLAALESDPDAVADDEATDDGVTSLNKTSPPSIGSMSKEQGASLKVIVRLQQLLSHRNTQSTDDVAAQAVAVKEDQNEHELALEDECKDESECVFCLDSMKNTLFLPCFHTCLCDACAFDYIDRTYIHNLFMLQHENLVADDIRNSGAMGTNGSGSGSGSGSVSVSGSRNNSTSSSTRHKHLREATCPTCARAIQSAIRTSVTVNNTTPQ